MYDFKTAIKLNRLLIIVLIIGAIGYVLSSSESKQINHMMTGLSIKPDMPSDVESMEIRLQGTINKNLVTGYHFNGKMYIRGEEYNIGKQKIIKLENGKEENMGQIYFDKDISKVAILIGNWYSGDGTLIIAPAYVRTDAVEIANSILDAYLKDHQIDPID
ncbi:MAG TPA: hypothetical protein DCS67_02515 [Clostridiales bacterium UBA8960]|nr:hypothetical protein [Clostridiales bacterium UBA8960]